MIADAFGLLRSCLYLSVLVFSGLCEQMITSSVAVHVLSQVCILQWMVISVFYTPILPRMHRLVSCRNLAAQMPQNSFWHWSEERQAAEQTNNGTVLYIFVRYITTFFWERNQHQKCPSRFVKWISSVSAAGQVVVFFLRPFLSQRTLLCRTGLCFHYFSPQRPDSSLWSVP